MLTRWRLRHQTIVMKKNIFLATALLAGQFAFSQQKDAPPPPPVVQKEMPPAPPTPTIEYSDHDSFLEKHKQVKRLSWSKNHKQMTVHLKSGATETYNLATEEGVEKATAKYGALPVPPPPPPVAPPPPKAPKKKS